MTMARRRRLGSWRNLALKALVILGAIILLHMLPTELLGGLVDGHTFDIAHVFGFAVLTFILYGFLRQRLPQRYATPMFAAATTFSIMLSVGVVSEASQYFTPRDADLGDLIRDVYGIASGLLACAVRGAGLARASAAIAGSLGLLAVGIFEPATMVAAKITSRLRFPLLEDFEGRFAGLLIDTRAADLRIVPATVGWDIGHIALIDPSTRARYPGIEFLEYPEDWSSYSKLTFRAATRDAENATVSLRINDKIHQNDLRDRFNIEIELSPVPTDFEIPLEQVQYAPSTREMQMNQITSMILFATGEDITPYYVDDFKLE